MGLRTWWHSKRTDMLVRRLLDAGSPVQALSAVTALERHTGINTQDLLQKSVSVSYGRQALGSSESAEWYARNGYGGIAGLLGGYSNFSNIKVSPDTALESAAVYACAKILGEDLGSLPCFLIERSQDGQSQEKAYGNPLFRALHDEPNPEMSAGEFREVMIGRAALGCDALARIERTSRSVVLWPINGVVREERNSARQLLYHIKEGNDPERTYAARDIFNLRGFTLDGYHSDPILMRARHVLGITLASQEYVGRFFSNDASPGTILKRPAGSAVWKNDQVDAFKAAWEAWHKGSGRAHSIAVIQEGSDVIRLEPDHRRLQMLEGRKFQVIEVARLFRMPLDKLGDLERATYSNIEQQDINYAKYTLMPWKRRWEEAVERCLLSDTEKYWPNGQQRLYVSLSLESLLRGDFQTQTEGFSKLLEKGVYSINEVRRWFDLNPIEGGDMHHIQLNMQAVSGAAREAANEAVQKMVVELLERKMLPAPELKEQ